MTENVRIIIVFSTNALYKFDYEKSTSSGSNFYEKK